MTSAVSAAVAAVSVATAVVALPAGVRSGCAVAHRAVVQRCRATNTEPWRAGTVLAWWRRGHGPMWIERRVGRVASSRPVRRMAARWSARAYDQHLAFAVEAAARRLRTGASLTEALEAAAAMAVRPVRGDLEALAARTRMTGMRPALAAWVAHRPLPAARLVAAVLVVGFTTGGATADALDGVAAALRERASASDEARSLTAQARLSARVLGVAPAAFAFVVSAIDPRVAAFLVTTPTGLFLLVSGVVLDLAGVVWMRRVVAGAVL